MTMTHIETIELGSSAASIEFTSIPQDGVDLLVVCSLRGTSSLGTLASVNLNADTTNANYSGLELVGNGSTASSNTDFSRPFFDIPDDAFGFNIFSNSSTYISNYTSSSNKSISTDAVTENNGNPSYQKLHASVYNITTAISSIRVQSSRQNFAIGSTASLYKIS